VSRYLVMLLLAMSVPACQYTHEAMYPTDVTTVAVPIFESRSFYQGVEFDVTEAITKEIERRTPYKVVSVEDADTVLEGVILEVDQRRLSQREDGGLAQELAFRILVDFTWTDARSGDVLRSRQGFDVVSRYVPAREVGETYRLAQHRAAAKLAEGVVAVMRSGW